MFSSSDNQRGAFLMVFASVAFTIGDTAMKFLGSEYSPVQAIFLRGIGVSLFLIALAMYQAKPEAGFMGVGRSRRDWILTVVRGIVDGLGTICFMAALFHLPMANVMAISQSLPFLLTLAGLIFLGERVGPRRIFAILAGLVGVALILKPGPEGFNSASVYAIASVGLIAVREIMTRMLSPAASSTGVAAVMALMVTLVAALGLPFVDWVPVSGRDLMFLLVAKIGVGLGYVASVSAMRVGEVSFVAPFRYTTLLAGMVAGIVIFNEIPDLWAFFGSLIIVASGLYIFLREQKVVAKA